MAIRTDGFTVDLLFPDEYSDFIAELYFREDFLGVIDQEKGFDNLEIEFDPVIADMKFPLDGLSEAIEHAKRRLWETEG